MLPLQIPALARPFLSGLLTRFFRRLGAGPLAAVVTITLIAPLEAATAAARDRNYLYVASPSLGRQLERGGHGILVFDIDDHHKFVKRIPSAGLNRERVSPSA